MNRLKGMTCYLCGPMDRVPDAGSEWREYLSGEIKRFGVGVFNPCDKPSDFAPEDEDTRSRVSKLKESGDYSGVASIMKPICSVDLRMVDIAHFIVMNLDMDTHLCGSYHEAFLAVAQKKPVLIRCKQGVRNIPNWMFGVVPHQLMFGSWSELTNYLRHVDRDTEVDHLDRWRFFDFDKVFRDVI